MRIAILGESGQLARSLRASSPRAFTTEFFDRQRLDLGAAHSQTSILGDFRPDLIVNAAAYTQVDRAEAEPAVAFAINADGPRALAAFCDQASIPLIHISTDYVFDGCKPGEYVETDDVNPLNVYGASKLQGEVAVRETVAQHLIVRTSWVFSEYGQNFVKTMLRLGVAHPVLRVVADQTGRPTHAGSLAAAVWRIIERMADEGEIAWGTYHLAGSPATTWATFAEAIFAEAAYSFTPPKIDPIPANAYPTAAKRPTNSSLCCNKFETEFGFGVGDWRNGLRETVGAMTQQKVV